MGLKEREPPPASSIPFSAARRVEAKNLARMGEECVGMFDRGWDAGSLTGDLNDPLCSLRSQYSRDPG